MSTLYSIARGDPQHPAVVCIHGLLGSSRNLFRLYEALATAGFYVIAYDQRGHGHSPHGKSLREYTMPCLGADVFEILDDYKIDRAHLVGHSLGARVSLAAAALKPERILSLSMLDAGVKAGPGAMKELHKVIDPLPESFRSKNESEVFFNSKPATYPPAMRQFLTSNLREREGTQKWNFDLKGIREGLFPALETDQSDAWSRLNIPLLVARGAQSEYFREENAADLIKKNPNTRVAVIPNAGHWVHVDNLVDTAKIVIEFLKGVTT